MKLSAILFIVCHLLFSCGENTGKVAELKPKDIDVTCEIVGSNLENFFTRQATSDIDCLGQKLKLFTKIVEPDSSSHAGYLSRQTLENFIKLDPTLKSLIPNLKFISLLFDVTNLIFGDSDKPNYLKMERIDEISGFLQLLNLNVIEMNKLLEQGDKVYRDAITESERIQIYQNYMNQRNQLVAYADSTKAALLKLFAKGKMKYTFRFSLEKLLDTLEDDDGIDDFSKYKNLLFVKRIFLGGDNSVITQPELFRLAQKSSEFLEAYYDIIHFNEIVFADELTQYQYYRELVKKVENLFYFKDDPNVVLFTIDNLEDGLSSVQTKDGFEFSKYYGLIPEVKSVFMDSISNEFKMKDFLALFSHARNILLTAVDFSELYRANADLLSSPQKISEEFIRPAKGTEKSFERFKKVITHYRYFKGHEKMPYFGDTFKRSEAGVIEIGIYEVIFEILAEHYEKFIPCTSSELSHFSRPVKEGIFPDGKANMTCNKEDYAKTLTQGQLEYIVLKLKDPLFELDLVTKDREFGTAENGILMTDLFQYQSDSSVTMNAAEGVEFGLQLIAAVGMRDEIMKAIDLLCRPIFNPRTKLNAYEVGCVRENFFKVLGLNYTRFVSAETKEIEVAPNYELKPGDKFVSQFTFYDFLPRFNKYQEKLSKVGREKFLYEMELFTRTCAEVDPTIPYERPDLVTIFGAIFNIEAALARFDTDNSNELRGEEVHHAYMHYRAGLKAIVKIPDAFVEPAFYLLIKEMHKPSASQVLWNKYIKDYKKNAFINQTTVASVLAEIKISSENKMTPAEEKKYCKNILLNRPK